MTQWIYRQDQEIPSFAVDWYNRDGTLIDYSDARWEFELQLVDAANNVVVTVPDSVIVGAADSPNVTVPWAPGELNQPVGDYTVQLRATDTITNADNFFRETRGQERVPPVVRIEAPPTP